MTTCNITLSADQRLISLAREKAFREKRSLNAVFREWLTRYAKADSSVVNYAQIMAQMKDVEPGRTFNRDELNAR